MKPHFFMTISANQRMEFQAELFVKSLEYFGNCNDYFFDLFILEGEVVKSVYLKKKVNINTYKPSTEIDFAVPWACQPRYSIKPKSEICIHVDADIFVLSEFKKILNYCKIPGFYGAIANDPPFSLTEWKKIFNIFNLELPKKMYLYKNCCGDFKKDKENSVCPFYPNNGFLVIHSKYVEKIKIKLNEVLFLLNKEYKYNYYLTQFAVAVALQIADIPTFLLPNEFNFITSYKYKTFLSGTEKPTICHYKNKTKNLEDLKYHKQTYEAAKQILKKIKYI